MPLETNIWYRNTQAKAVWSNYRLAATCGPPQRFEWPAEAFRIIFKSAICWKASELTFVSLNYLHWIWIAFAQEQYLFCVPFCIIHLFYDQIEGTAHARPPLGTWLDNLCFFGAPAFVVLKSTSGAMNSVPPNKSVYLSAKRGLLKVAPKLI